MDLQPDHRLVFGRRPRRGHDGHICGTHASAHPSIIGQPPYGGMPRANGQYSIVISRERHRGVLRRTASGTATKGTGPANRRCRVQRAALDQGDVTALSCDRVPTVTGGTGLLRESGHRQIGLLHLSRRVGGHRHRNCQRRFVTIVVVQRATWAKGVTRCAGSGTAPYRRRPWRAAPAPGLRRPRPHRCLCRGRRRRWPAPARR